MSNLTPSSRFASATWLSGPAFALCLTLLLTACGTLPPQVERPFSQARQAPGGSPLVLIARNSSPAPELTGFRLMAMGFESLDVRIQLARRARDSLDVQYYLIQDDRTGRLLMRTLRDAALRGVKVRLLVDDLYTAGSDDMFRGLAAFPNVEVRLFNPFCCARHGVASKFLASIGDIRRLNHRMHNKLFIADGAAAVMGGRNIADEYFTRSATFNFVDMDVLAVGRLVQQLSGIFDVYWNSPQSFAAEEIIRRAEDRETLQRSFDRRVDEGEQMMSVKLPAVDMLGHAPIGDELDSGRLQLMWGTAVAFADRPDKVMATSDEMSRAMSVQMDVMGRVMKSQHDVLVSSPYFVPGRIGVEAFTALRKRNVTVTVLTNSLAANDVPLVHIGYARYRTELLRAGVDLYELSPRRLEHEDRTLLPGSSTGRLHAKAAVMDQNTVYIGSMNLDPRSESTNTELGMIAECPELAAEVIRALNISKLQSAYRLRFAPDGQTLQWLSMDDEREIVLSQEPEVTPFMRLETMLLAPFVPEQLL